MLSEEDKRFLPGIFGGFGMVAVRSGILVKRVFGTLIHMVLKALIISIDGRFELWDLRGNPLV